MEIDRRAAEFLVQREPELPNARAGIEDDDVAVGAHSHAGRVAAVTDRRRPRDRDRPADAPEFYPSRRRMKFQAARLTPCEPARSTPRTFQGDGELLPFERVEEIIVAARFENRLPVDVVTPPR